MIYAKYQRKQRLHDIDESSIPFKNVPVRQFIGRAIHNEHRRKVRAERSLPPAPGFIVFRTDYSNEGRWEQWQKEFQRIIDASMASASGGKKIEDKCLLLNYEDGDIAGATFGQILQEYSEYQETESIPKGLDTGMCLVVDSAAMDSITCDKPWVYALDLSFDYSSKSPLADGAYPGYFQVAVESVITELYPMLTAMTPPELWPSDNTIWESAF
ncbi:hypothetical protein F1880_007398 [Penicillium rolfsii]|nr:hypothetical protein F1880_007398 [Penicillium rolfsii]